MERDLDLLTEPLGERDLDFDSRTERLLEGDLDCDFLIELLDGDRDFEPRLDPLLERDLDLEPVEALDRLLDLDLATEPALEFDPDEDPFDTDLSLEPDLDLRLIGELLRLDLLSELERDLDNLLVDSRERDLERLEDAWLCSDRSSAMSSPLLFKGLDCNSSEN